MAENMFMNAREKVVFPFIYFLFPHSEHMAKNMFYLILNIFIYA